MADAGTMSQAIAFGFVLGFQRTSKSMTDRWTDRLSQRHQPASSIMYYPTETRPTSCPCLCCSHSLHTMSTRRAVRVARATRTTRRTVEQQQLQYQHQQLDPSGLAGVFGFGSSSTSGGGGGGDAYYASAPSGGGVLVGDGSTGLGGSGGGYNKRPPPRGKPARQWIQVRRPPAPGVGFTVAVWVPVDQLTEAERAIHLPPSTHDGAALHTDTMVAELPIETSVALPLAVAPADDQSAIASVDATAPTTLETEPGTSAAPTGPLQQGLGDKVPDGTSSHANDAVPSATCPEDMAATAGPIEDALLSPNDRPTKRARFAQDGNEPIAAEPMGEQPGSTSVEPSATERHDEAAEETTLTSLASVTGAASTEPPSQDVPANPALLPPQPPPASATEAPAVLLITDNVSGRKRDLLDTEPPMGDSGGEAAHDGDGDGPPPKRARTSAEDDDSPAAARAKESDADAGASAGARADADADAQMTIATAGGGEDGSAEAVMEHQQPSANENVHASASVGGLVEGVDGQPPESLADPSQAPVGDSQ
jgi:hypothetical protein